MVKPQDPRRRWAALPAHRCGRVALLRWSHLCPHLWSASRSTWVALTGRGRRQRAPGVWAGEPPPPGAQVRGTSPRLLHARALPRALRTSLCLRPRGARQERRHREAPVGPPAWHRAPSAALARSAVAAPSAAPTRGSLRPAALFFFSQ